MGYPVDRIQLYNQNGTPLPELYPNEVESRVRHEEINGEHTLTLVTKRKLDVGWRAVTVDGMGKWREWVVEQADELHEAGINALGTYRLVWSLQYDLSYTFDDSGDLGHNEIGIASAATGAAAVAAAIRGSKKWTVSEHCDVPSIEAGGGVVMIAESAWERLSKVVSAWGGEIDAEIAVDATGVVSRKVLFAVHLGKTEPTRRFEWGEDLTSIKRTPDPGPYYCRVVPIGRGTTEYAEGPSGADPTDDEIEYEWPLSLLDDPVYDPHSYEWIEDPDVVEVFRVADGNGGWEYPTKVVKYDEDDVQLLYEAAMEDLHNHTRPNITYEASVVQFARAGFDAKGVALGDEIQVVDRGFNPDAELRIQERITSVDIDELDDDRTELVIGQIQESLADTIASMNTSFDEAVSRLTYYTTPAYVRDLIGWFNNEINRTGGYTYLVPGRGQVTYDVAVSDPNVGAEATKAVEIRGGSIRIGTRSESDGSWTWKSVFIDGTIATDLVVGGRIVTGSIGNASSGNYWDLDNGTFRMGGSTQLGESNKTVDDLIVSVDVQYAESTSNTVPPENGWTTTCPPRREGYYIWQKTVTYTNSDSTESEPTCISGRDGISFNNATLIIYKRSATEPAVPSSSVTYSFDGGGITGNLSGWSTIIPNGEDPCWVTSAVASSFESTDTILSNEWAEPAKMFENGTDGMSNAVVMLYQRSASTPSKPSGSFTYTFATGTLSGSLGSWRQTIPSGTDPCWVIAATAASPTATDTLNGSEFSDPVKMVENGVAGTNSATVYLYQRKATQPSKPTISYKYTFSTGAVTTTGSGSANGWSTTIPSGDNPCWIIAATATGSDATDTIPGSEFSDPAKLAENGTDGLNQATIYLYQRKSSQPSKPSNTLTYTFATGVLSGTINNGWSKTIPTGTDPCWVTSAVAIANTATDTIASSEWADVSKLAENGVNGANTMTVILYKRAASQPTAPTSTITVTFSTGAVSGTLSGWSKTMPSGSDPCWVTSAVASSTGTTDTIPSSEWSTVQKFVESGMNTATVYLYQRKATQPSKPTSALTYTFSTGKFSSTPSGWSQSVPDGTDPCWLTCATAISAATTDTIAASEWSDPVKLAANGLNTATVRLYRRYATQPSKPSLGTLTYTFSSGSLTGSMGSWSATIPSGTDPCWMMTATAASYGTTDTILSSEWSDPIKFVENGLNQATIYLYKTADTQPSGTAAAPTASLTYTFLTHTLSSTSSSYFNGWSQTVPSGSTQVWVICATAVSTAETDTVQKTEWSTPVPMTGKDGVGISAVTEQYCLLNDGSRPTSTTTWSENQQVWVEGKSIWTRSKIDWDDGTTTYTDPVLAEAINGAYRAIVELDNSFDADKTFNRLTENGTLQGLYKENNRLYINATYIGTGILASNNGLSYFNLTNGTMQMVSEGYASGYYNFASLGANTAYDSKGNQTTVRGFHIEHSTPNHEIEHGMITVAGSDGTWEPDEYYSTSGVYHSTGKTRRNASCISSVGPMYLCGIQGKSDAMRPLIKLSPGSIRATLLANNDDSDTYLDIKNRELRFNYHYDNVYNVTFLGSTTYRVDTTNDSTTTWNYVRNGGYPDAITEACWLNTYNIKCHYVVSAAQYIKGRLEVDDVVDLQDDLTVAGSKNRVVTTADYGKRLLYCYETSSPMFGDMGSGTIDETGVCVVSIDDILSETMRTDLTYYVFLQKCGEGDLWVSEKSSAYFIVEGTPGLRFDWELKAKQTDYEYERLETKQDVTAKSVNANASQVLSDMLGQEYNDEYIQSGIYTDDMALLEDELIEESYVDEMAMIDWS